MFIIKKYLLVTMLFFVTEFNNGFAEYNISSNTSKPFAADLVGYFKQLGVEYSVWVYLPDTHITRVSWYASNGYLIISPSFSGTFEMNQTPTTHVTYVDAFGNTATFNGVLYNY